MQSVGTILWDVKTDYVRSFRCSTIIALSFLSAIAISILPALAREASETGPSGRSPGGNVTAVASANVIKSFTMNSKALAGTGPNEYEASVSRRTALRSCDLLLGADSDQASGASCELRLMELQ